MNDSVFASRRGRVLERLPAGLEGLIVSGIPNVRYLTGFTGSSAVLTLFRGRESRFFTDPRYDVQAHHEVDCPVHVSRRPLVTEAAAHIRRLRTRRIGFERGRLSYQNFEFLGQKLRQATLEPVDGLVEAERMVKSPAEIEQIRLSVHLASRAFEQALGRIRLGKTSELDLAAEIDYRMCRLGAEKPAFDTIVAGGERSALPHASPTQRLLQANELLLVDMGAVRQGYASDMTRVLVPGRPSRQARRLHRAVLEAQEAALSVVRPGITAAHVDRQARRSLRAAGLDHAFVHSTGHGLGLEIHEGPRLGAADRTRLREGMVITVEPGVYLEGFCGVRIEDTVVVTASGCEILTPTPKTLIEL